MKGIPTYSLVVEVARGVFQFGVLVHNLRETFQNSRSENMGKWFPILNHSSGSCVQLPSSAIEEDHPAMKKCPLDGIRLIAKQKGFV